MMTTFLLTFVILLTILIAMSVGVLFGRKPIKGSCGGMASLGMETECDICGGNPQKCEEEQKKQSAAEVKSENYEATSKNQQLELAYDATKKRK